MGKKIRMSILQTVSAWLALGGAFGGLGRDKTEVSEQRSEVRGQEMWEKIRDDQIRHVWKKADDDDCKEYRGIVDDCKEYRGAAVVPPGWYEDNGTPICDCGEDMVYSHTEILKRVEAATNRHCENCRWNSEVRYRYHLRVPCHKCDNTSHWREIRKGGLNG